MTTVESRPGDAAPSSAARPTTRPCCGACAPSGRRCSSTIRAGALQRELDGELPVDAGTPASSRPASARSASPPSTAAAGCDPARAHPALDRARRRRRQPAAGVPGHFALAEDRLWQHARGHDQRVWFDRFAPARWSATPGRRSARRRSTPSAPCCAGSSGWRLPPRRHEVLHDRQHLRRVGRRLRPRRRPRPAGRGRRRLRDRAGRHPRPGRHASSTTGTASARRAPAAGRRPSTTSRVPAAHVLPFEERFPYQTGLYQLNLLATLTGIARAALDDVVDAGPQPHPQLLPRQRAAGARRRPGPRPGRRDRRRRVRRRGRDDPGGRQPPGRRRRGPRRRPDEVAARGRGERDRVVGRAGGGHRAGAAGDAATSSTRSAPRRPPAPQGAGPALAQRPHGRLAQPADPQVPRRRGPRRQRHPAAVRLVDRRHPPAQDWDDATPPGAATT